MDAFPNKEAVQVAAQKEGKSVTEYIMEQYAFEWSRKMPHQAPRGWLKI